MSQITPTQTITKETISRLINDIKQIIKNPLCEHGIYYQHDEEDMLKGYALIVGPEDTPYFGGYYFFIFDFPCNYPYSPPKLTFCTNACANNSSIRFNPNLYVNGKVCISVLNTWRGEQWTACQTISTILLSLSSLLCVDPLLNEPGFNKSSVDMQTYTSIIEYSNINVAICDIIVKNDSVFSQTSATNINATNINATNINATNINATTPLLQNNQFSQIVALFRPFVVEHFLKNFDKFVAFVDNKIIKIPNAVLFSTTIYYLRVDINYVSLRRKLIKCDGLLRVPNTVATAASTAVVANESNGIIIKINK